MPKLTRIEIEERERYTIDVWKQLWPKGQDASGNVPAATVNDIVHKKFGEYMRSDKVYHLRDRAVDELRTAGHVVPNPPRKYRRNEPTQRETYAKHTPVAAERPPMPMLKMPVVMQNAPQQAQYPAPAPSTATDSPVLPHMIRGVTPDGAVSIAKALDELRSVGLTNLRVEHSGPGYVLVHTD